jgi:WD40-like Beta Propeller Repeat
MFPASSRALFIDSYSGAFAMPILQRLPAHCTLFAFVALFAGCGQPVREDRSINWSGDGESVGFQHGQEGIFLADKDSGKLTRIFQPGPEVIACSTPLWSPIGKRVIFTTARSRRGQTRANLPFLNGEQDPAGNVHFQQDIIYTCWLYEPADGAKPAEPVALFEAAADHPGYVAANLAVRWHPRLERIDYVKQVGAHQHGLFEFDLGSKQSRQILPHTGEAMLFDWTPDGSRLACLMGSTHGSDSDGIWIGRPDQADWWHVPHSNEMAPGEFGSLLENLRSTRPAWTADGKRFAFASHVPGERADQPGRHFLRHGTLGTQTLDVWAEGDQPFRDLHWDKDGSRLGVVRGGEDGSLHLARQGEPLSAAINRSPVRRFAGWSADNKRLAYIVPGELSLASTEPWPLLLIADTSARDKVYVAAGDGTEPGRSVFSGMRVTFPQWSPREDKLSLWVTFTPAFRSVVSHLLGWGLRRGDPAAIFDPKSGEIRWMLVSAQEKIQVGHYYLLKRDYARAWHWYEEAERELPRPEPAAVQVTDTLNYLDTLRGPRDFSLFQFHCLTKLGRAEEARAKLEQFRQRFLPKVVEPANGPGMERQLRDLFAPGTFIASLLQDMYAAEVYLSLDAAVDGEAYFRRAPDKADTESARLSRAIALGQILLLEKKYTEYADHTTDTIAPLLSKLLRPMPAEGRDFLDANTLTQLVAEFAVAPLGAPEFLSLLPDQQRKDLLPRWEDLRTSSNDGCRPLFDLVLHGLYRALGREKERQDAAARLKGHEREIMLLSVDGNLGEEIITLHTEMRNLLRGR